MVRNRILQPLFSRAASVGLGGGAWGISPLAYALFVALFVMPVDSTVEAQRFVASRGVGQTGTLVRQSRARAVGLERAWYGQVQIDPTYTRKIDWKIHRDRIVAVTGAGIVQMWNAESGQLLWTSQVGNPNYPTLGPAIGDGRVAVVNGSTLYVLNGDTGREMLSQRLYSAAGAAPVLASDHVFLPLLSGRIEGHLLTDRKQFPWYYKSSGHAVVQPIAANGQIFWGTDNGSLFAADSKNPTVRYRFETSAPFVASPAFGRELIVAANLRGDVFALRATLGTQLWKYSSGFSVTRAPAVIDGTVYVSTDEPALHAIDLKTGRATWVAAGVSQFAAQTSARVFGVGPFGNMHMLDKSTGGVLAVLPSAGRLTALVNDQSDQVFLASAGGTVQCLREGDATEVTYFADVAEESAEDAEMTEDEGAAEEESEISSFEAAVAEPAAEEEAAPVEETAEEDDDPFGGFGVDDGDNPFDF